MSVFQGLPGYDFCLLTQNPKGGFQLVDDKQSTKRWGNPGLQTGLWTGLWTGLGTQIQARLQRSHYLFVCLMT